MLPFLSFRSLERFLDRHAGFGPVRRYAGGPDLAVILHCGNRRLGHAMAFGRLDQARNFIAK